MKIVLVIVCLLIFLMAWVGFPDIIKCPYKVATGSPCLFCGTLTGFSFVLHGRICEAWSANPIGIFVFVGLLCFIGRTIYEWR